MRKGSIMVQSSTSKVVGPKLAENFKGYVMTHRDIGQAADWVKAVMSTKTVRVDLLGSGTSVIEVASVIFDDYEAMVKHRGASLSISKDTFLDYISNILQARIDFVNRNVKVYNIIKHNCYLPHIFATLIASIGVGIDDSTGFEVLPTASKMYEFSIMDADEILAVSTKLKRISLDLGISMATELAKSSEGNPNVLLFNSTEEGVLGRTLSDATPLAVLALMLETKPSLSSDCFPVSFIPKQIQTRVLHAIASISSK